MKVIFGKHINESQNMIRYWKYDEKKYYSYELKESNYAVVRCKDGLDLVKIVGYGELKDDESSFVTKEVIQLLKIDEVNKDGC